MQTTELALQPLTKNNEWWLRSPDNRDKINFFESPVCYYTEHRFIALLLLLLEEKGQISDKKQLTQEVTIYNKSATKSTRAVAIHKKSIVQPRSRYINLGSESHLIVTGTLAGSVAVQGDILNNSLFFADTTPVQLFRPLIPSKKVTATLEREIYQYSGKEYDKQFPGQIPLLIKTQEILVQYGYMGALFYLLNQLLEVPIDEQSMIHNSRLPFDTTIEYI